MASKKRIVLIIVAVLVIAFVAILGFFIVFPLDQWTNVGPPIGKGIWEQVLRGDI